MDMKSNRALTLPEILIVLLITGIAATIAVPRLVNITSQANEAAERALVESINEGIRLNKALDIVTEP